MRVRVVQGEVHGVLLAFAGPQLPNAPPAVHQAQLFALEAIYELGKTSEFKGALSEVEGFFSLLFTLRDCDTKGVIELSHRIASHWSDDFFGWVWECCALCKRTPGCQAWSWNSGYKNKGCYPKVTRRHCLLLRGMILATRMTLLRAAV